MSAVRYVIEPSGSVWHVVAEHDNLSGHRDTSKGKAGAQRIASELRRGLRRYDVSKGYTVPVKAKGKGVLDGLLGESL